MKSQATDPIETKLQSEEEGEPKTSGSTDKNLSYGDKIKRWYHGLPDKKRYIELVTAVLTIPVLLTIIISNVQNLQNKKDVSPPPNATSSPKNQTDTLTPTPTTSTTPMPTSTPSQQCKKEIGPISIVYPEQGDVISKDPVCLDISRTGLDYCSVVWSYRINGGSWSDYTDKSICIYGLSAGTKNLELRVKSIVTGAEIILTRTFTVLETATPTPMSTSSASLNN